MPGRTREGGCGGASTEAGRHMGHSVSLEARLVEVVLSAIIQVEMEHGCEGESDRR